MIEKSKEFHDACVQLFMVLCRELRIDKVVDWLNDSIIPKHKREG
jgi:hypothetical protein